MSDITTKDILAWLDMQRDAVNTEIVYAPQSEKKQYHKHLEIINRLAELVRLDSGEMTAVELFETVTAECEKHDGVCNVGDHPCKTCPFDDNCIYATENWRNAIEIVKRWKEKQKNAD